MAPTLSAFLAIVAVGLGGDPITQRWSIGGSFAPSLPLFPARGIAGTHNKYEGDASIMRVSGQFLDGPSILVLIHRSRAMRT